MALKTFVKISSVSNLSDARYCAGMGVDQLGFNLNPTEADAVSPERCLEIFNWVAGVHRVGEFGNLPVEQIGQIQLQLPLDLIEISVIDHVEKVHGFGKPVSLRLNISHPAELNQLKGHLSYLDELVQQVVITSDKQELFEKIIEVLAYYNGHIRLIRGFGNTPENLDELATFRGIELKGSQEEKPGFKEYGEVMDLLEALEID
jgi:phosphoribosylanthranilate isomerase